MPSSATLYRAAYLPSSDIGNITTETQFTGSGIGKGQSLILPLPNNGSLSSRNFNLRVAGRVATTKSGDSPPPTISFTVSVYFGYGAISANTLIYSSGPTAVKGASNWEIAIPMFWDADSNTINGNGSGQLAGNVLGSGAIAQSLSAIPLASTVVAMTSYGFTVTGLWASSNAGNHAYVDIFDLEMP